MAMVNFLDGLVGRVVAALQAKGMWDNTLWVSSADNGGAIYQSGAAGGNNFPLRGGKVSLALSPELEASFGYAAALLSADVQLAGRCAR